METLELIFSGNQVRFFKDECEEYWFVAKDVCYILNIKWRPEVISWIDPIWKGVHSYRTPLGGTQKFVCINEPALYLLTFRSNKPEAKEFTKRVIELIRKLRKAGAAKVMKAHSHLDTRSRLVLELEKLDRQIRHLQNQIGELPASRSLKELKAQKKQLTAELARLDTQLGHVQLNFLNQ